MSLPKLIVLGNFLKQKPTGVQRYAVELTRALSARNPGRVTLLSQPGTPIPSRLSDVPTLVGSCWPSIARKLPGWAFLDAPTYLRFKGVGKTFVWNPSNIGSPHIPNQVITLHDLSFYRYPTFFTRSFRYKHRLSCALTLPRVTGVTTVSHTIRAEIEERYPYLKGRIGVVPNGVSECFLPTSIARSDAIRLKYNIPDSYFLTIGSVDPRKNSVALVRSYVNGRFFEQYGVGLVLVGGTFATFAEDPSLQRLLRSPGVQHLGYLPDEDLPALYSQCRAFVFPSIYEGFGIPLIEALACGANVICSDIPVFREIGGTNVTYFSLKNENTLTECLQKFLGPQKGSQNRDRTTDTYSWERSAEIFEIYLSRLSSNANLQTL
jgi:glycosyltransferase involved in cell wall biosynthesis